MKWERIVSFDDEEFIYKAIITRVDSEVLGERYDIEIQKCFDDGSYSLIESLWHDKLAGAKRLFDMDYNKMGNQTRWTKIESE